jgi:hypothetical protein
MSLNLCSECDKKWGEYYRNNDDWKMKKEHISCFCLWKLQKEKELFKENNKSK